MNVVFIGEQNLFANKWWKSPLTGKFYGWIFLLYMFGASRKKLVLCLLFLLCEKRKTMGNFFSFILDLLFNHNLFS